MFQAWHIWKWKRWQRRRFKSTTFWNYKNTTNVSPANGIKGPHRLATLNFIAALFTLFLAYIWIYDFKLDLVHIYLIWSIFCMEHVFIDIAVLLIDILFTLVHTLLYTRLRIPTHQQHFYSHRIHLNLYNFE